MSQFQVHRSVVYTFSGPPEAAGRGRLLRGEIRNPSTALAFTLARSVSVKRFFFHLRKARETLTDDTGTRLTDLEAVVTEAQRIAVRIIVSEDVPAREWTQWKLDVKDEDGTRLFFFPFEEVSLHDVTEAKALLQHAKPTARMAENFKR